MLLPKMKMHSKEREKGRHKMAKSYNSGCSLVAWSTLHMRLTYCFKLQVS
jgi:hypothetical protein